MFLRHRSDQIEYFDSKDLPLEDYRVYYASLGRINRITRFDLPFRRWLPALVGNETCKRLKVLDLGSGDGLLGRQLSAWAAKQGWSWDFTNLDLSTAAKALDPSSAHVIASATAIPFEDGTFDAVIASAMTHHFANDEEVVAHFKEASRVSRRVVLLCDLHRNFLFLVSMWVALIILRFPRPFRQDAVLSVRRGWRLDEWHHLAKTAGLKDSRIWLEHGTRILIAATK
jgi:ubiquinone/menaquinone biosynthesis C-methylase UbiE